jgi:hypothetical protein
MSQKKFKQRIVRILISNTLPISLQVFCLLANVTHLNLNAHGGSERLAIATMESLSELEDVELELSTFQRPNIIELQSAFGQSSVSVIKKARTMRILNSFDELSDKKEYDLNINTHGDLLPFLPSKFFKEQFNYLLPLSGGQISYRHSRCRVY